MRAMILAAGRGTRMRELTRDCPKPLLQAGGKPLIVWQIERLRQAGLCDIVINHAYLGTQIENALGDGSRFGVHLSYSPETQPLETAGGIRQAMPLLGDAPFVVVNGDVFCDADLAELQPKAETLGVKTDLAHLLLVPNPAHNPAGDFELQDDRVIPEGGRRLTFSGTALYHPALFADITPGQPARLAPLLHAAAARGVLGGTEHHGRWLDVGTPERLAELDRELRQSADPTFSS